jgi:hypothetical protein
VQANLKVDVEEADGAQEIESATDAGTSTDPWYSGNAQMPAGGFTASSNPNSRARDSSITGLRVFSIGAAGSTITFSYEFAPLRLGDTTDPLTFGPGAEGYQQYRVYSPYGAQRLFARSWSGSMASVDLYANRLNPANPGAYVDKSDTPGTSTETLIVDDLDSTPLPTNPGWWFVNMTGLSPESVSIKVELELTAFHDTAERFSTGGALNGWMPDTRNESRLTTTYNPWHFSASSTKSGSRSLSAGDATTKYPFRTDSVLAGPMFNLTSVEAPWLSFWTYYDFQGDDSPNGWRLDGFWIEMRSAGSTTWTLISPVGDYPMTTANWGGGVGNTLDATYSGLPGHKAFTMESGGWVRYDFDLAAYSGQKVFIRFHFWSNPGGWTGGTDDQILYIDQISITHRAVINEVLASEGARNEFVEIYNPSSVAINMDDWRVRDGDGGIDLWIRIGLDPLQPGAYLWIVLGSSGTDDYDSSDGIAVLHYVQGPALNPADDSIVLVDDRGGHVDFVRFGSSANDVPQFALWTGTAAGTTVADQSYGRDQNSLDTDDSSDWESTGGIDATGPTPGGRNLGAPIPQFAWAMAIAIVSTIVPASILIRRRRHSK